MEAPLIETKGLKKHFRSLKRRTGLGGALRDLFSRNYETVKAVDGVDLSIGPGELVGFIGPNGAGKSTTIKMLVGVLKPTEGSVSVAGFEPFRERTRYVKNIGVVLGQRSQLWWDIPVIESFKLLKEIYGIPKPVYDRVIAAFDELAGMGELMRRPVRNLSLGQRMLCDICASFLHGPRVIFLDEPTIGLDVDVRAKVRSLIGELNRREGTTILLTSHDVRDIETLARRIVLIDKGKVLYDGPTERFLTVFGRARTLRLDLSERTREEREAVAADARAAHARAANFEIRQEEAGWIEASFDEDETPLVDVLRWFMERARPKDVSVHEVSMEEVIRRAYAGELS